MGAVNYKTSDYITIGLNPNDYDYDDEYRIDTMQMDYDYIQSVLNKYDFWYYHVTLQPGYYEGFTIDIQNNFGWYYDDYTAKRQAMKETTQVKKFLLQCAENGLVSCSPGWCTGYKNYSDTIRDIDAAVCNMRYDIKSAPTYYILKKCGEL